MCAFLLLQTDPLLEVRDLWWFSSKQTKSSHQASQNSRIFALQSVANDSRSSTESTFYTSLVHNIASVGKFEQEHTSVLKLVFQHWMSKDLGIHRNALPRLDSLVVQPCNSRISSFCMKGRIPSWKLPCNSRCMYCKCLSISFHFIRSCSKSSCVQRDTGSHCAEARLLESQKKAADGSFGAGRFSKKRFPIYQMSSVYQAASKNRGWAFHEDSEYSWDDWERGTTQNCFPFQDHRILRNRMNFSLLSCNSWIWTASWFTLDWYSVTWIESSSILNCFDLSASVQHIFSILLFPEDLSYNPLEELFLSCPILCIANCSLSLWNDQIIVSPGKVPSFESEAEDLILEQLCLHFRPSMRAYPARIWLQTANNLVVLQGAISYDIPIQSILKEQLFSSGSLISQQFKEIADFAMLRENSFSLSE